MFEAKHRVMTATIKIKGEILPGTIGRKPPAKIPPRDHLGRYLVDIGVAGESRIVLFHESELTAV